MSVNKVILIGNLGSDPDLHFLSSGSAVCNLSLATNRRWTGDDGEKREKVTWHSITAWGQLAEHCERALTKGDQVYVDGRLELDEWEDRETGQKRQRMKVVAESVQLVSRPRGSLERPGPTPQEMGGSPGCDDEIPF